MKLWNKGFSTDKKIDLFTVGNDRELDLILAKHDVIGNIAHAKMLHKIGLLTDAEIADLEKELKNILHISDRLFYRDNQAPLDCYLPLLLDQNKNWSWFPSHDDPFVHKVSICERNLPYFWFLEMFLGTNPCSNRTNSG